MDDDKPLTQTERLALADRNPKGQFVKGHKPSSPGRPKGAVGLFTKSLREQVLDGIGDVPAFVRTLKTEMPGAAAALLSKLIPSADAARDAPGEGGMVLNVTIGPVTSGTWFPPLELERRPDPRPPELRIVGGVDATDDEPPGPAA
jgi:hypothetical protein